MESNRGKRMECFARWNDDDGDGDGNDDNEDDGDDDDRLVCKAGWNQIPECQDCQKGTCWFLICGWNVSFTDA